MKIIYAATLTVLLCGILQISAQSTCQTCMENDAYCIDATSYYLCLDRKNPAKQTFSTCDKGKVCTASANICEPEQDNNGIVTKPACGSSCGVCPDYSEDYRRYACVSRTQFGRCVDKEITLTAKCEDGSVCSSELYAKSGVICAPQCVADFYGVSATCNSDEIVTTTTTTTTSAPVNTADLKEQCVAALPNYPNSRFFYIKNSKDNECKTYIYCEKFNTDVDALLIHCNSGYFDQSQRKCVSSKPSDCGITTTTDAPTTTTTSSGSTTTTIDSTTTTVSSGSITTTPGDSTTTTTVAPTTTTTVAVDTTTTNLGDSTTTTIVAPTTTTTAAVDSTTTVDVSTTTTNLGDSTTTTIVAPTTTTTAAVDSTTVAASDSTTTTTIPGDSTTTITVDAPTTTTTNGDLTTTTTTGDLTTTTNVPPTTTLAPGF